MWGKSLAIFVLKLFLTILVGYPILLLVLSFCYIINSIFRLIIAVILRLKFGETYFLANGADSIFSIAKPGEDLPLLSILLCDYEPVSIESEREHFQKIFQKTLKNGEEIYKKMKYMLSTKWGYGCFIKDKNFSIDNHVLLSSISPIDEDCLTESEFFENVIPPLVELFQDTSKPRWEYVIVPKLRFEGKLATARILRFSHSYMDGVSAAIFLASNILSFESPQIPFVVDPFKKMGKGSLFRKLVCQVTAALMLPYFAISFGIDLALKRWDDDPCFVGMEPSPLPELYGVSKPVNVESLKALKSKYGTSCAVFNVFRKALVKHFKSKGVTRGKRISIDVPSALLPHKDFKPRNQALLSTLSIPFEEERIIPIGPTLAAFSLLLFAKVLCKFPVWFPRNMFSGTEGLAAAFFNPLPFTRRKGKLFQSPTQLVENVGSLFKLFQGTGLAVFGIRYGEDLRFWCVSSQKLMTKPELEMFMEDLVELLDQP